jgi:hypothetical protein
VDAVQHIIAIAERERRKRAQKEAPDQQLSGDSVCERGEHITVAGQGQHRKDSTAGRSG